MVDYNHSKHQLLWLLTSRIPFRCQLCTLVEAIGQEPDADIDEEAYDAHSYYDVMGVHILEPLHEVQDILLREEHGADEEQNQGQNGPEDEVEEEGDGNVVLVLPGIEEAEAPGVACPPNEDGRYQLIAIVLHEVF